MPPIIGETDYLSIMICNILLFPLTKEKALFFYNKNIHRLQKKRLILSTLEFSDKKKLCGEIRSEWFCFIACAKLFISGVVHVLFTYQNESFLLLYVT